MADYTNKPLNKVFHTERETIGHVFFDDYFNKCVYRLGEEEQDFLPINNDVFVDGKVKHYKGNYYQVLLINVWDEEERDYLVIYESTNTKEVYARPQSMFFDEVEYEGKKVYRFDFVTNKELLNRKGI